MTVAVLRVILEQIKSLFELYVFLQTRQLVYWEDWMSHFERLQAVMSGGLHRVERYAN